MDRKHFLRNSIIGITGICFSRHIFGAEDTKTTKGIRLLEFPIAGYQYYDGAEIEDVLEADIPLCLVREKKNKYDEKAVAVHYRNYKLGFIPRNDNEVIANMLDQELALSAKVSFVDKENNVWERIWVEVEMGGGIK
jgi:hypothetical protein